MVDNDTSQNYFFDKHIDAYQSFLFVIMLCTVPWYACISGSAHSWIVYSTWKTGPNKWAGKVYLLSNSASRECSLVHGHGHYTVHKKSLGSSVIISSYFIVFCQQQPILHLIFLREHLSPSVSGFISTHPLKLSLNKTELPFTAVTTSLSAKGHTDTEEFNTNTTQPDTNMNTK